MSESKKELNTKDLMCELFKGLVNQYPSASDYGRSVRGRLARANLSELQILRFFSYHCEENGINPDAMFVDLRDFVEQFSRNQFILKTDNRWSFLPGKLPEYYRTDYDTNNFICTRCFAFLDIGNKTQSGGHCVDCNKLESQAYYQKKKKLKKAEAEKKKAEEAELAEFEPKPEFVIRPALEPRPAPEPKPAPVEPAPVVHVVPEVVKPEPEIEPFINLEEITGGQGGIIISLSVDACELSQFLKIVDPYIAHKKPANSES